RGPRPSRRARATVVAAFRARQSARTTLASASRARAPPPLDSQRIQLVRTEPQRRTAARALGDSSRSPRLDGARPDALALKRPCATRAIDRHIEGRAASEA